MTGSERDRRRGFTMIELIVSLAILGILTSLVIPMARTAIRRQRERELRYDLLTIRDALDRYKEVSDRQLLREKGDSSGYPKSLDILVTGVEINGGKTMRFLREVPKDPMTGKADWGMLSMEDDPNGDSWDETAVYDVFSKAEGTGMDGSRYRTW